MHTHTQSEEVQEVKMNRFGVIVSVLLASALLINSGCQAKQAFFEFENDPHYPQLVTVSDVQYELVNNKYIQFSGVLTVYEELNESTNVSVMSLFLFQLNCMNRILYTQICFPFSIFHFRSKSMCHLISHMLEWLTTWM